MVIIFLLINIFNTNKIVMKSIIVGVDRNLFIVEYPPFFFSF